MVELNERDKLNIAGMSADATKYALFDDHDLTSADEKRAWMSDSALDEHSDDVAVDRFAAAMKAKLRKHREQNGRGGWDDPARCTIASLIALSVDAASSGDTVTEANYLMMIWNRKLSNDNATARADLRAGQTGGQN